MVLLLPARPGRVRRCAADPARQFKPDKGARRLAVPAITALALSKFDRPAGSVLLGHDEIEWRFGELHVGVALRVLRDEQFPGEFRPSAGRFPHRLTQFHTPARRTEINWGWGRNCLAAGPDPCVPQASQKDQAA